MTTPELPDPEHELNPDVYRAPEPVAPEEDAPVEVPAEAPVTEVKESTHG